MSINNNQNHNIDMPTISAFLSDLRYLLKLDIKQNKQVEIAKSIQQKTTRFNTLINSKDDPSEELGTLNKIVSRLRGISKFTKNHKKYLNSTERNALTCYKKVIETQY